MSKQKLYSTLMEAILDVGIDTFKCTSLFVSQRIKCDK